MTLDGTQTLVASRITKLDSRGASERDLVLLGGNSGRWSLEKDQDDGGIALEKGGDRIIFSVGNLFVVSRNPSKFVDSSNPFVCWWSVTNRFVDDLNGAR